VHSGDIRDFMRLRRSKGMLIDDVTSK